MAVTNKIFIIAYSPLYLRSFLDNYKTSHEMRSGWKQNTSSYQLRDTRNSQFVEVAKWFSVARQDKFLQCNSSLSGHRRIRDGCLE